MKFLLALVAVAPLACTANRPLPPAPPVPVTAQVVLGDAAATAAVVRVEAPRLRTDTRPLPADVAQYRSISSVRVAPDGSRVAYIMRVPTLDPNAEASIDDHTGGWSVATQLYLVERVSGEVRQLTYGEETPYLPRWSPDGTKLSFLRYRGARPALHVLDMRGGEARVVNVAALNPDNYRWSPDGTSFAFTSFPEPSAAERTETWRGGGVERFDREWRSAALYVVDARAGAGFGANSDQSAQPRRVSQGTQHIQDFEWSPDGQKFAVKTAESADPYHAWGRLRLVIISAKDGAQIRQVQSKHVDIATMAWSPDGRYLAYESASETLSLHNVLRVHDVAGNTTKNVADALDPTLAGFVWAADSSSVIAHVLEHTRSTLYRLSVGGARPRVLARLSHVVRAGSLTTDRTGRYLAVQASSTTEPPAPMLLAIEKKRAKRQSATLQPLVASNPQVADWTLAKSEVIRWQNLEGTTIEGILYNTPHAKSGEKAPLMVLPHGGPDGVSTENFNRWAHYFAARGYSVLLPNYRGGFGRGYQFYAANRGRLGDIEFADIEPGVDHLIATGKVDSDRLYYGGWSWGGYITAWTITKTARYKAAVVGAGIVDVTTQYVTSDINHGYAADWEFKGNPWRQPENFDRANPARRLNDIRTPTLILHGRNDRRVAFVNGMVLYRALADLGVEVSFLAYPREPHSFTEPAHIAHMLEAWAHWYDSHQ